MSWPKLPRLNPCLPCVVGNPDEGWLPVGREGEFSPDKYDFEWNEDYSKFKVHPLRWTDDASYRAYQSGAGFEQEYDNPRGKGPWVVWHKDSCARVRNGKDQEKTLLGAGYRRVASLKSHQEADDLADAKYGGRTNPSSLADHVYGSEDRAKNPNLLVLNPHEGDFVAKVEVSIKRKLSSEERVQLEQARKEYRTFHGRDPDSFVPVEVPKGTPRFVNLVGDVDRIDYTVRANSERKGKWTHKAGDHGQTSKGTKPALLVSVPGKKAPPVFAQRKGSEMYFKPTHGIMG